jgi:hypothetical protein
VQPRCAFYTSAHATNALRAVTFLSAQREVMVFYFPHAHGYFTDAPTRRAAPLYSPSETFQYRVLLGFTIGCIRLQAPSRCCPAEQVPGASEETRGMDSDAANEAGAIAALSALNSAALLQGPNRPVPVVGAASDGPKLSSEPTATNLPAINVAVTNQPAMNVAATNQLAADWQQSQIYGLLLASQCAPKDTGLLKRPRPEPPPKQGWTKREDETILQPPSSLIAVAEGPHNVKACHETGERVLSVLPPAGRRSLPACTLDRAESAATRHRHRACG